jgi:ketosteroid isomerase-like protein
MDSKQARAMAEVMAVEARWVQAHRDLDAATIAEILDDDYKRIHENGSVIGKDDVVAYFQNGWRHWDVAEGSDYSVQVFDNVALVYATWHGVGTNGGEPFDYSAPFLAVYVRRADGWKLCRDETLWFKE